MKTIINWIDIKDEKPIASGWYMTICVPVNYDEFKDNPSLMNYWIANYGMDKTWFNNVDFWSRREYEKVSEKITDRVIFWSKIPDVPQL
ncbi:hypothetical protein HF846_13825 [Clostridium cadaveris]|uniref:hypothetical protein n=1 Tax=Clostridium cadaveris TaxID=1529 RepID=UPI001459EFCE|nr:hypothetical protein [Clostridium cadaveris]NME65674.1 hypothetical protein [Clostridium cadaveris]